MTGIVGQHGRNIQTRLQHLENVKMWQYENVVIHSVALK